jgi:CubicO group peptidase (beta-lactamase class C family)
MKYRFLIFLFLLFFICGQGQSPLARIDSLMKSQFKSNEPGAVIAITLNQTTLFKKSYGLADLSNGRPVSADDNFNIGSLTKQFTAFALLDLYYKGKCSLNDSIGKYFKLPAGLSSVLISQLLSHSSGIPDHYSFTDTSTVKHATDKDVLAALRKADTLYFTSGTRYRYSNSAYCLLGMLIEKLSGLSYPAYLQAVIFGPLGIQDASVFQYDKPIKARVTGYDRGPDGKFVRADADESIFFSTEADGGIYISMNNYMKWCAAIEYGDFSKSPMIRKAWQGQTEIDTAQSLWYGCGWFIRQATGLPRAVYHTGFNGGFRTVVFMIPSENYCISIFTNRAGTDLEELVTRINSTLSIADNSFIKSGPLESFIHTWPIFAPCKETSSFSTSSKKNLTARDMALN